MVDEQFWLVSATAKSRARSRQGKVAWPLSETLENGPVGVYISELKMLHREACLYLQAGHYEEANQTYHEALAMAQKTLEEYELLDAKIREMPPVKTRSGTKRNHGGPKK
eukprot:m.259107 g.259107  ORF g.259107 m.259107 type:complete len:110 (+) comp19658_c0_seq3:321-650(+)